MQQFLFANCNRDQITVEYSQPIFIRSSPEISDAQAQEMAQGQYCHSLLCDLGITDGPNFGPKAHVRNGLSTSRRHKMNQPETDQTSIGCQVKTSSPKTYLSNRQNNLCWYYIGKDE
jgi:hypothetical protein